MYRVNTYLILISTVLSEQSIILDLGILILRVVCELVFLEYFSNFIWPS